MAITTAKNDYRVYAESTRQEMLRFVPKDAKRILEVGCSVGNFGELLKQERGAEVWGVEPDLEAAEIAATKLDRVINGFFSDSTGLPEKYFDCIVFNDVLEHLVNPEEALADCKMYMASGATVVASIPNILFFPQITYILVKQDWKYQESGVLDRTHLRFFTKKSIVRMFQDCGFNVETIKGVNAIRGRWRLVFVLLTLGILKDWKYMQFAVRGRRIDGDKK